MSQFNLFSKLPQELQDLIWDAAIRDDGPAAQFFTIYDPRYDTNATVPLFRRIDGIRDVRNQSSHVGLVAPQSASHNGAYSWVNGNASAYMTDSGLWTACWASRQRMLWHFKLAETSALMSMLAPVGERAAREVCRRPTASVTMPFWRDNGERQYLTIRPMEDLLVFQYAMNSQVKPSEKRHWRSLKQFPPFRWQHSSGGWHSPLHVRNIAVPYDPQGTRDVVGPTAGDINGLKGFWFIDYALQRRYQVPYGADRRDRQTFHVGGDWEFVEVGDTDDEWWDPNSRNNGNGPFSSGAFLLAAGLQWDALITHAMLDLQQSLFPNQWNTPGTNQASTDSADKHSFPRIGVLAYVKRGSEKHLPTRKEWIDRCRREST